ncbi:MAG: methyl-accepting chemotaxis protein [Verrucomicrobia bacterium]|nr:methyl-accepting chemotaxis protein [Verrucomicrobiota bacterium]
MFSGLRIRTRILLSLLGAAALSVAIAALGLRAVRSLQSALAQSSTAVIDNLGFQNQQLERKTALAALADQIMRAGTIEDLDKAAPAGAAKISNEAGTVSDTNAVAALAESIARLLAAQRTRLESEHRLQELGQRIGVTLDAANREVASLVAAVESEASTNITKSLLALAAGSAEHRTANEAALKQLHLQSETALRTVNAVLLVRASVFELNMLLCDFKHTSDKARAGKLLDEIQTLFGNVAKRIKEVPADKAASLQSEISAVQIQVTGSNGLASALLALLEKRPRPPETAAAPVAAAPVAPPGPAPSNSAVVAHGPVTKLETPNSKPETQSNSTVAAHSAVPAQADLAARFLALQPRLDGLGKSLLAQADDALFDSALSLDQALKEVASKVATNTDQLLTGTRRLADTLTQMNRKVKSSLAVQSHCQTIDVLLKRAQQADKLAALQTYQTAIAAVFQDARKELAKLAGQDSLGKLLAEFEAMTAGPDGFLAVKTQSLQAGDVFAQVQKQCQERIRTTDQGIIHQAQQLKDETDHQLQRSLGVAQSTQRFMLVLGGLVLLVSLLAIVVVPRSIARPLAAAVSQVQRVAARDLTVRLDHHSDDELGQMSAALNRMVGGLRDNMRAIAGNARTLSNASQDLNAVSANVSANAEDTSNQANMVASAAAQVSQNITTVAHSAEEMSACVREIAKQTVDASKVANQAVAMAQQTNATIANLSDSSVQIGNVTKVITSIAEQTNLLALNATIEAARAGEAGKGFAVVANEVKELARQTSKATEEISRNIGTIQNDARASVAAIQAIGQIIKKIDEIQTAIAGAVEEQAATTNEISQNAKQAATSSLDIARNIGSVSEAARSSTHAATSTSAAAQALAQLAQQLNQAVGQFKIEDLASPSLAKIVTESVRPSSSLAGSTLGQGRQTARCAGPGAATNVNCRAA